MSYKEYKVFKKNTVNVIVLSGKPIHEYLVIYLRDRHTRLYFKVNMR